MKKLTTLGRTSAIEQKRKNTYNVTRRRISDNFNELCNAIVF
jgi:hypothetical protein